MEKLVKVMVNGKVKTLNLDTLAMRYIKQNHNPEVTYSQVRDKLDQKLMAIRDRQVWGDNSNF